MLRLTYPYQGNTVKSSVSTDIKTEVMFTPNCKNKTDLYLAKYPIKTFKFVRRTRRLNYGMSILFVILVRFPSTKKAIMNISPNALPDGKPEFKGNKDDNNPFEEV
jgi:hypothetical protein